MRIILNVDAVRDPANCTKRKLRIRTSFQYNADDHLAVARCGRSTTMSTRPLTRASRACLSNTKESGGDAMVTEGELKKRNEAFFKRLRDMSNTDLAAKLEKGGTWFAPNPHYVLEAARRLRNLEAKAKKREG